MNSQSITKDRGIGDNVCVWAYNPKRFMVIVVILGLKRGRDNYH